jgi:adenylosuccinate lyase
MIPRYTLPEMGKLWTDEYKFGAWLKVEVAASEAWAETGRIPKAVAKRIKKNASFSVKHILKIEEKTKHDVVAFVNNVAESVGKDGKYVHYGLTSSDVLDTANALLLKEAGEILITTLDELQAVIKRLAFKYKDQPQMGRTHGIHAEPTSLGLKFALWYDELKRDRERLLKAVEVISYGKISGAVGAYGNVDPRIEKIVCRKLGLKPAPISTQVNSRDRYAEFIWAIAMTATSLEKFALELRHLQRTEVREVEEGFDKGQAGSSAMPHKKNPISAENICGLARVMRANLMAALENVALWHERDISHSSAERIILPDSTIGLHYMMIRLTGILKKLVVYPKNLEKNINLTGGLYASGSLLLALTERLGSRQKAYAIVQAAAHKAWNEGGDFKEEILKNSELGKHFKAAELEKIFDVKTYLKHANMIFKRVFK